MKISNEFVSKNPLLRNCIEFSLEIIKYCERLDELKKYVVSKQLLRSATSIGANSFEAQNPESKADFIHKLKIAAKEAEETEYWLILCDNAENYPNVQHLLNKLSEIKRILAAIIYSSKEKR